MVKIKRENTLKTGVKQVVQRQYPIPAKIRAETLYELADTQMTAFGGLLVMVTFLDLVNFKELFESYYCSPSRKPELGCYRMVPGFLMLLFIGFARIGHFGFIRQDPMVCGIMGVSILPAISTFWRYLTAKRHGRLLEIGCGSGAMLNYMGTLGWQTEGTDVDQSAVANAQGKGLKVSSGSLEQQNYQANIFDAIMLSHVIEHVPDPKGLLRECYRILKPGGILTMVTPNNESIGSRICKRSWMHLDPPRHLVLYNCRTHYAFVREAGFTEIKTRTTIRDAHSLFWGSYSIHRHGTFTMGSQPLRSVKSLMQLLRLVEGGLIKIFPRSGEEISLTGIKK